MKYNLYNEKFVVWGAGNAFDYFYKTLKLIGKEKNILDVVDSDTAKAGRVRNGLTVQPIDLLWNSNPQTLVIICADKWSEIKYELEKRNYQNYVHYYSYLKDPVSNQSLKRFRQNDGFSKHYVFSVVDVDNGISDDGLCSLFLRLIYGIIFSESKGIKPIYLSIENMFYSTYSESGFSNIFSQFFQQISEDLESYETQKVLCISEKFNEIMHTGGYSVFYNDDLQKKMADVVKRYFVLQPEISDKIQRDIRSLQINMNHQKILAVHYRAFPYANQGHPIKVTIKESIDSTKKVFQSGNYHKIFLATDDTEAINAFQLNFEDDVVFYSDVTRSDESLYKSNQSAYYSDTRGGTNNDLCSYEMIRDLYTLSYCSGAVIGLSGVTIMLRLIKQSREETFHDLVIIDKGLSKETKFN